MLRINSSSAFSPKWSINHASVSHWQGPVTRYWRQATYERAFKSHTPVTRYWRQAVYERALKSHTPVTRYWRQEAYERALKSHTLYYDRIPFMRRLQFTCEFTSQYIYYIYSSLYIASTYTCEYLYIHR